jgi:glycosyltransferase involved in cell wall biosynthesis
MADSSLNIMALSPYHGGPRQTFVEELSAGSAHRVSLLTLPPRTWPWRLKGSAIHFAREIARLRRRVDLIFTDDLVDAARLRALLPGRLRNVPIVQYFHTDVLSGDLKGRPRDEPLAMAQLTSVLAANRVLVASAHHRSAICAGAERLVATFPDAVPVDLVERVERTVSVQPPGIDVEAIREAAPREQRDGPPRVLWNHPWVEEQRPAMFFETLDHLDQEGIAFRLIVVGLAVRKYPDVFDRAKKRLARHIVQFGFVPGRDQYLSTIRAADIVVSTAEREWFPLGTIEATLAGATPLVSRGLANSEVFGDALGACSYRGPVDLRRRLARLLTQGSAVGATERVGEGLTSRYAWRRVGGEFDALFVREVAENS